MANDELSQMLGRIDGKLDQAIRSLDRHIDDDVRRFTELHSKVDTNKDEANEKFEEHSEDINKAKGAKGAVIWLVGGGAAAIGGLVAVAAKAFGG